MYGERKRTINSFDMYIGLRPQYTELGIGGGGRGETLNICNAKCDDT